MGENDGFFVTSCLLVVKYSVDLKALGELCKMPEMLATYWPHFVHLKPLKYNVHTLHLNQVCDTDIDPQYLCFFKYTDLYT